MYAARRLPSDEDRAHAASRDPLELGLLVVGRGTVRVARSGGAGASSAEQRLMPVYTTAPQAELIQDRH